MSDPLQQFYVNAFDAFDLPIDLEPTHSVMIADVDFLYSEFAAKNAKDAFDLVKKTKKIIGVTQKVYELVTLFGLKGKVRTVVRNGKTYIVIYDYIKSFRPKNITTFLESNISDFVKKIPLNKSLLNKTLDKDIRWNIAFFLVKVPIDIAVSILHDEPLDTGRILISNGFDLALSTIATGLGLGVTPIIVSATAPVWVIVGVSVIASFTVVKALEKAFENFNVKKNLLNTYDGNFESPKRFMPDR